MTLPVSFEFFPPKTPEGAEKLRAVRERLYAHRPEFCSVTYGAGGSTQEGTFATVGEIIGEGVAAASHFSCIGASKASVRAQLATLRGMGVRRLVALRGDLPSGYGAGGEFQYASDLVSFIRAETGDDFHIEVAAYPEVHPEAASAEADLDNLKRKLDAGASRAITQFFFDPEVFFRFRDKLARAGIDAPVIPGILPVSNVAQTRKFAAACGAQIPGWMDGLFEGLDTHPASRQLVAATISAEFCRRLYAGGVRDFHFYTLNRAELSYAICHLLGLRPKEAR